MSPRRLVAGGTLMLVLAFALPREITAAPKTIQVPGTQAAAAATKAAPAATKATPAAKRKDTAVAPLPARPGIHRPLMLDVQRIEGRADGPRVLFVHAGPQIALEDAPEHPSYLRDDFTAALSSPLRVRVRPYEPLRLPTKGESR